MQVSATQKWALEDNCDDEDDVIKITFWMNADCLLNY